ncbi:uncharacterized protein BDV17DRAFT_36487 [Aspergillus undulatus]|uniref:uncharacterized protein n=1 Tax=Aspergillus undulatus TaxID=1810928 RepID=UPI003CCD055A
MSSQSCKRQREHEELPTYNEEFVRERKKHRSLPLRSSPKLAPHLKALEENSQNSFAANSPSTLTPVESSDDETGFFKPPFGSNSVRPQQFLQGPNTSGPDCDTSMDMDIAEDSGQMDRENKICQSSSIRHTATATRYPRQSNIPTIAVDSADSPGRPVELSGDLWWHCPRLPSPVSDNGDSMSDIKGTSDEADMDYELSPAGSAPLLSSVNSPAMEAEAADMRERLSSLDLPDQANAKSSSNLKPPKKLGFSMGYRADCDKCRRRVPGHYSHIIG